MQDLLAQGSAWLSQQRRQHCAQKLKYSRPSTGAYTNLAATLGRTVFDIVGDDGGMIRAESRDFIVVAADLKLDGIASEPAIGDRFTDSGGVVFEVLPFGGEPHWRWADEHRADYRIHTKRIDTVTV